MKKILLSSIVILLVFTASQVQAGGGRGMGGGPRGGGQSMGQRQGGNGDRRQERARIHQQQNGEYRQGAMEQRREMNQNRIRQTTPAYGATPVEP